MTDHDILRPHAEQDALHAGFFGLLRYGQQRFIQGQCRTYQGGELPRQQGGQPAVEAAIAPDQHHTRTCGFVQQDIERFIHRLRGLQAR